MFLCYICSQIAKNTRKELTETMIRAFYSKILLYLSLACLFHPLSAQNREHKLLQVLDQESKTPLDGVAVHCPSKQMLFTDSQGEVLLPSKINLKSLIHLSYLGYKERQISLSQIPHKGDRYIVYLKSNNTQLQSITVKGLRKKASLSAVSSQVSSQHINKALGKSLANLLVGTSGLSSIQTGANTAKPVIHGMHGNRILIVNNGVKQSGQQWGDAHAPEIDFSSNNRIQVVKGAEAVRYGSEAMGGVILMQDKLLPYQSSQIKGAFNSFYASNGRSLGANLFLEGAMPFYRNLAYRIEGKYSNSGDHSTANYLLNNTGHRNNNLKANLGWEQEQFSIEAGYIRFEEESAIMPTANLGNVERLLERIKMGRPDEEFIKPFSRKIDYPREDVLHQTLMFKANYEHSLLGKLKYQFSYQSDKRKESRIRRNNNSHIPELSLNLNTIQQQLHLQKDWRHWAYEVGVQTSSKDNYSEANTGVSPIIPNYTSLEWGTYFIGNYKNEKWYFDLGLRYDGMKVKASSYDKYGAFYYDRKSYDCLTYSFGARFKPNKAWQIISNFGLAWRSPHVFELYSDGVQHGSGAYIRGNKDLQSERGYKWISSIQYRNKLIDIQLSAYLQWVKNFIYDQAELNKDGSPLLRREISGNYPIFGYKQTNAFFRGADLDIKLNLSKAFKYKAIASLVLANEMQTKAYLPYIPPMRINQELSYFYAFAQDWEFTLGLSWLYVFKQKHFDAHKDLIKDTPPAYQLWGLNGNLLWKAKESLQCSLTLDVENLLNAEYKEYTNRSRYYAHDLGRNVRAIFSIRF